jgi:hypothetical protein
MGQRTLAFTKQMLRVFNLVELEEPDHLVPTLDHRFLEARKRIATRSENEQAQANEHIYMHKNVTPYEIKHYKNVQYKIEFASMVTRGKETSTSKLLSHPDFGAPKPEREHNHQVCWDQVSHI